MRRRSLYKNAHPARSPIHGWGLFATHSMRPGAIIDESPFLRLKRAPGGMTGYYYRLHDGTVAVPLGDGMLCNSSTEPNARNKIDKRARVVRLIAIHRIERGEEITIDYTDEDDEL